MPSGKAVRVKRTPLRTCVSCGSISGKRALIRLVRAPEGGVHVDPTGKRAGRGAYLCHKPECWEQAIKRGRLERSLRAKLSSEDVPALRSFIRTLVSEGVTE